MASFDNFPGPLSLTENDIPGASLLGRKPEQLKNEELRFWLKCRGDPAKGLKTKAELVKRVNEYIASGRDKSVVDPDPNSIYTRRKEQQKTSGTSAVVTQAHERVIYPNDGWSTSLEKMPMFTRADMNRHITDSGKNIADANHHSVPTGLRKAKRFLDDEYLQDIVCTSDQRYFYFKSTCCHSFRKNDPPHNLKVALCVVSGSVQNANCSCVAGASGYCNHILALMFKFCKFSLFSSQTTTELSQEEDDSLACTSQLQKWHNKGGGRNIAPQPVMEVEVNKTKLDETRVRSGVKPLLYDARAIPCHSNNAEQKLKEDLKMINPNMGLAQMACGQNLNQPVELVETRYGKAKVGSFMSYQVSLTESNFKAEADLSAVPRLENPTNQTLEFPKFPLKGQVGIVVPENTTTDEREVIEGLSVDMARLNTIEKETRKQAESNMWKNERKFRFTASRFHVISRRQRNHETFAQTFLNAKNITSRYLEHGRKYESVALQEYEKYMFNRRTPVQVISSGLVVSKGSPILGATPDAKVIDPGCTEPFGLAEVKCPYTKHNVTPLDACSDSNFFMKKTGDNQCMLKEDHQYHAQVQGQMGVTGAQWCDFITYTSKGLYVQRIPFKQQFWDDLKCKLEVYYLNHFIKFVVLHQSKENSQAS